MARIETCEKGHRLSLADALPGRCDGCMRAVDFGEKVHQCRKCNYYLCDDCRPLPAQVGDAGILSALADLFLIGGCPATAVDIGESVDAHSERLRQRAEQRSAKVADRLWERAQERRSWEAELARDGKEEQVAALCQEDQEGQVAPPGAGPAKGATKGDDDDSPAGRWSESTASPHHGSDFDGEETPASEPNSFAGPRLLASRSKFGIDSSDSEGEETPASVGPIYATADAAADAAADWVAAAFGI